METNWTLVYSAGKMYQMEIIQEKLRAENIPFDTIDKKDSFLLIGEIELYVPEKYAERVKAIVLESGL